MTSKALLFRNKISETDQLISRIKKKSRSISLFRIITFLTFAVTFIIFLNIRVFIPIVLLTLIFSVGFGLLVRKHNKIKSSLDLFEKIRLINQGEVERLEFQFDNLPEWDQFNDDKHPYSGDLDLYGKSSLFQLINRAETKTGILLVKKWLENAADKTTIGARQLAVQSLASQVDWRQKFQAFGKSKLNSEAMHDDFFRWLVGKDQLSNRKLNHVLPIAVSALSITLIIGVSIGHIPFGALFAPFIVSGIFLIKKLKYSQETYELTSTGVKLLQSAEQMLDLVEKEKFEDPLLQKTQKKLMHEPTTASGKILQLKNIFDLLNLRGNQIYHFFNALFLLDFVFLMKAERWRQNYKDEVAIWFDALAEFEALNSLAAFSFSNDDYSFPTIAEGKSIFSAKEMGHPLIPPDERVINDYEISGIGRIDIITGSNMAGKSTFLRTVGVNAILALAGAPVCAKNLNISAFQVFTSMRTKDNLEEHISSFYAELLRLKTLLNIINTERPILFLLDEILKGTNSADRHIGAQSLTIQLSRLNCFGLISTHDLKLGKLNLPDQQLKNYNFSSSIAGEEIAFDYKLREGICQSTNASQLMAKMGIDIRT